MGNDGGVLQVRLEPGEAPSAAIVHLIGELDSYTAPQLKEMLSGVLETETPHVVFDLSDTAFIDSTGLGVMVGFLKRARSAGGDIGLRNIPSYIFKVLEITGLSRAFTIVEAGAAR